PACLSSSAVARAFSSLMSAMTILAPAPARLKAMARPRPWAPPVTTATFPVRLKASSNPSSPPSHQEAGSLADGLCGQAVVGQKFPVALGRLTEGILHPDQTGGLGGEGQRFQN